MTDTGKKGKPDRIRINTRQSHEMTYWTKALGVSSQQLVGAVRVAGPMVVDVKKYLKEKGK